MRRWSILGHRRPAAAVHGLPSLLPATVLVLWLRVFSVGGAAPERERVCARTRPTLARDVRAQHIQVRYGRTR